FDRTRDGRVSHARLLDIAIREFGTKGLEGASTRGIAAAAGTAMSAITYHFGGKDELYRAVARYIAERIAEQFAPALMAVRAEPADDGPVRARAQIKAIFSIFIAMLLQPESASWARFIVREQMEPTPAFDELYNGPMGPMLGHVTALVRRVAAQRIDESEARLRAIALFGQVLVFRVARATVMRSTGWAEIGAEQADAVQAVVLAQVDAVLDTLEAKP
ncbi:MAG TPA: CerR family C-terminal domain-containing protein, partial [Sphingomonas sp.]